VLKESRGKGGKTLDVEKNGWGEASIKKRGWGFTGGVKSAVFFKRSVDT